MLTGPVIVIIGLVISCSCSDQPQQHLPSLPELSSADLHELLIFNNTVGVSPESVLFHLDLRRHFAYLTLNDSRIDAMVLVGDGPNQVQIPIMNQGGIKQFLSANPAHSALIEHACDYGPCQFELNMRTNQTVPIGVVVRAMQGTRISPGVDTQSRLDEPEQFRMYGAWIDRQMLPTTIIMQPKGEADLDLTVYKFDNTLPGLFRKKFPGVAQRNSRNNDPERVLIQNLPDTFVRIDVSLISKGGPAEYSLRVDQYDREIDLYNLWIACTIGSSILLGLCMLICVCFWFVRSNYRRNQRRTGPRTTTTNGVSELQINMASEEKRVSDLNFGGQDEAM